MVYCTIFVRKIDIHKQSADKFKAIASNSYSASVIDVLVHLLHRVRELKTVRSQAEAQIPQGNRIKIWRAVTNS